MATTTQILFNSPALHSLKRDQLVRLCKRHGIKANGKNVELIERLKVHAQQLPPDAATIEYQDESNTEDNNGIDDSDISMTDAEYELREMGRPSEKWTMVMEDIEEVDEPIGTMSSTNTLSSKASAGEFGSRSSKSAYLLPFTGVGAGLRQSMSRKRDCEKATSSEVASNGHVQRKGIGRDRGECQNWLKPCLLVEMPSLCIW